ncbi:Spy/CpxP family protein refolding chaperone [Candidatus Marinarcus aquaticus]|uniref:Periplasmic heavy metal sensor n=1 Tax=Candidatus Marinarcus aquaticus TaxID=2044504 RepID=A0A4Q0XPC4_9BACT|nr:Spy/CpxP family protein refolding chaperone [Candidatus Marinarcus aquaticus]RXJ57539.1 hypothetical protein CRV04_06930 [Candidatus Marinarcus aquaticus]
MKTKMITGLMATLLGASLLNAQMMNQNDSRCDGKKAKMSYYKGVHGMKGSHMGIMPLLFKLNLTQEQEERVQKIMTTFKSQMPSPYESFSADKFDEEKYIQQAMTKKENMIKLRAKMISKVYDVLTDKQKSQLRVLMDLKEEKLKQGCRFDKNSNGRR